MQYTIYILHKDYSGQHSYTRKEKFRSKVTGSFDVHEILLNDTIIPTLELNISFL